MELTVLVDNNTFIDQYYLGEPAACYYLEDGEKRILFDVGYSNVFLQNAHKLEIDISSITDIVISHGHNDHTGGLKYIGKSSVFTNVRVTAHKDIFKKRYAGDLEIGCPVDISDLEEKFKLNLTEEPFNINDDIIFLGEIPSYNNFERTKPVGLIQDGNELQDDFVKDDSALVYKNDKGLFIITGCSHSGICNIVEHARHVCNEDRISGIIGGFHLTALSDQLSKTIEYFKRNNISNLFPAHCVSFAAKAEMNKHINLSEVGVGLKISV